MRFSGLAAGVTVAGEGLESVLSVRVALAALPAVAGLSAHHLAVLELPPGVTRLYIARDGDAEGTRAANEVQRIVGQIRARWPRVKIVLRADSAFAREALMLWCEQNRVDFVFGLARNTRLETRVAAALQEARTMAEATGQARPRVPGLPLVDQGDVVASPARDRQGGMDPGRGEPTLSGDLAQARPVGRAGAL